jgi:hypothetical protein
MNASASAAETSIIIPGTMPLGTLLQNGDRLIGRIDVRGAGWAIAVPPKALRDVAPMPWNESEDQVAGALSFYDGAANTDAMAAAGSKLAQLAIERGLYLPARDELELVYRLLKPTTEENWDYRNGDNPASLPPGFPYSATEPAQTAIEEFRAGAEEAIVDRYHWTSTQRRANSAYAWVQIFRHGNQNFTHKSNEFPAVLVRRYPIR